jgi:hypothetical protein
MKVMRKHARFVNAILKSLDNDDPVRKTRNISAAGIAVCGIVLFMETNGMLNSANLKIASDFIFIALLIIQFIFPANAMLLGIVTLGAGLVNVYYAGHVLGFLLYVFGLAIFFREGFFRTDKRFKLPLLAAVFIIDIASQCRIGPTKVVISVVNIVFAIAIIWAFLFVFHDSLKKWYSIRPPLELCEYGLTPIQIACLKGTRDRKSVCDIAKLAGTTEAAIRDEFIVLFDLLDVADRQDLYRLLEDREIIFEKSGKKA